MKKILKKEYLLIAFVFIIIFSTIVINPLNDLDEIWNYNVARNIADGKVPYKQISTITTPLLPFINSIFLNLFANEMIIMRVLASILGTAILYMIFKIVRHLTKEINISIIVTAGIGLLFRKIYCIDYNYMVLFLSLCALFVELCDKNNKSFWIGFLAGLAACTKQSIGAILAIIVTLYPLFMLKENKEKKQIFKEIGMRIIGISIPCVILLIYLLCTNSLSDFINYAIQGISTFDNNIPYNILFRSGDIEVSILALIMPIAIVGIIITVIIGKIIRLKKPQLKSNIKEQLINIQILTTYSLPMLVVIYPIADKIHFLIGTTISIITFIYCIFLLAKILYRKINNEKKYFYYKTTTLIIWIFIIAMIYLQGVQNFKQYADSFKEDKINMQIAHFKYIEIPEELLNRIELIDNYIKNMQEEGKNVYVLDAEAAIYMIPLNRYTKNYDMFLKGNIGKDGEKGTIEKIKNEADENTIYLVKKDDYSLNWQTPLEVITYVKENFEHIGEVSIYDAYMR